MSYLIQTSMQSVPVNTLKKGQRFVKLYRGLPTSKVYEFHWMADEVAMCTSDDVPSVVSQFALVIPLN